MMSASADVPVPTVDTERLPSPETGFSFKDIVAATAWLAEAGEKLEAKLGMITTALRSKTFLISFTPISSTQLVSCAHYFPLRRAFIAAEKAERVKAEKERDLAGVDLDRVKSEAGVELHRVRSEAGMELDRVRSEASLQLDRVQSQLNQAVRVLGRVRSERDHEASSESQPQSQLDPGDL